MFSLSQKDNEAMKKIPQLKIFDIHILSDAFSTQI